MNEYEQLTTRLEKLIDRRKKWAMETGGHEQAQHRAIAALLEEDLAKAKQQEQWYPTQTAVTQAQLTELGWF
jgi:hypothetical protein